MDPLVVLLVDDDDKVLRALKSCVDRLNARTVTAPSGLHAIHMMEKLSVDVVVTDGSDR